MHTYYLFPSTVFCRHTRAMKILSSTQSFILFSAVRIILQEFHVQTRGNYAINMTLHEIFNIGVIARKAPSQFVVAEMWSRQVEILKAFVKLLHNSLTRKWIFYIYSVFSLTSNSIKISSANRRTRVHGKNRWDIICNCFLNDNSSSSSYIGGLLSTY